MNAMGSRSVTQDIDSFTEPLTFQVLIRLQHLRSRLRDLTACASAQEPRNDQIEEVRWALLGMAIAARSAGLGSYTQVCMHLAQQVEHLRSNSQLHWSFLTELGVWLASSGRYLRHPDNPGVVAELVGRLNVLCGDSPMSRDEESRWFRALLQPH